MKLDTLAVHAGDRKKPGEYIPTTTPIYGASSYYYEHVEDLDRVFRDEAAGHGYSRYGNPTTAALEELMATLEGGDLAVATSSGMAALHLALLAAITDRRKSIVAANVLYGQTLTMLLNVLEPAGVAVRFSEPCDLEAFEAVVAEEKPACVLVETISNPLLRVPEIDKIIEMAHRYAATVIVDATFTTPVLMQPMQFEADFVVHSATKFLAGHGDVLGGVVVAREEHRAVLEALTRTLGPNLGPFEAYLTMRGIKTLPLRIERQCRNACQVAAWLSQHPRVEKVHFPGDPHHPDAATVKRLLPDGLAGAVVSFEIKDAKQPDIFGFIDALQLVVRATTLGDVHTLVLYPAMSTHRDLAPKQRERLGIRENLLRLSVGIEAVEDIEADLERALAG